MIVEAPVSSADTVHPEAKEEAYCVIPDEPLFSPRRIFYATAWWFWWTYEVGNYPIPFINILRNYRRPWASRQTY